MQHNLALPRRVVFGWGRRAAVGAPATDHGRRAFFVSGSRTLECNGTLGVLIDHVAELAAQIDIPNRLSALGVQREQIPDLVRGSHGNSLSGNPRDVSDAELTEILEAAL